MREALKKVQPTEFDDLVALVALYRPGAMDQIPTYARGKRNPETIALHRRAPAPDHRVDQGRDPLPGAVDADRQGARRLQRARRPTTCARRSARRTARRWPSSSPSSSRAAAPRARAPDVIESLWKTNEKSADYSFNKSHAACYALIAYRTAWLKANYPAEYMAALISSVMDTKDKVPFFVNQARGDGDRDPAARRQRVRPRVRRRRRQHPLRPRRGEGRRLRGGRGDQARPRGGRPVRVAVGLLRARRLPRGQQEGDRGADQVRRVRLDRRVAQGHARRARAGPGRRPEGPAGRADRPGLDLRPRRLRRRRRRRRRSPRRRTRRSRPRSSTAPSCWRSRRSRSACSSPRTRSRRCARRCARRPTARCAEVDGAAATASGSRSAGSSPRPRRSAPGRAPR